MEPLIAEDQSNAVVRYNLARLLEERGRTERANEHWDWLRANASLMPAPYYYQICAEDKSDCVNEVARSVAMPWDLLIKTGLDLLEKKDVQDLLNREDWQREGFDFQRQGMKGNFYWRVGDIAVLDLDGYVDMVVLYGDQLGSADDLITKAGQPSSVHRVYGGEIWNYGGEWAAVVREQEITEVWVSRGETGT